MPDRTTAVKQAQSSKLTRTGSSAARYSRSRGVTSSALSAGARSAWSEPVEQRGTSTRSMAFTKPSYRRALQVQHKPTRICAANLVLLGRTRPERIRSERVPGTKQHTRTRVQHSSGCRLFSVSSITIPTKTKTRLSVRAPTRRPYPLLFFKNKKKTR